MGIFSAIPIIISSIQDSPTVLFSVAAAAISKTLLPDADLVATIVVMTGIVTLLTGLFMFLLGFFRLGGLGRYLPYPLTGGFLAGTGWLLVQGSFGTMAGISPSLDAPPILMNRVSLWLPGLLFAIALFVGVRVSKHPLTLPIIIFGTIVLFLDGWH
jgi:SulP family sulfate permease